MKRFLSIVLFLLLVLATYGQEEMRVVDSLESAMAQQEGRERVKTMMELSKAFFDFSFDDCVDWGEKAIEEARRLGLTDLEGDATSFLGEFYGEHADNDLAQNYLRKARIIHLSVGKEKEAINDLWLQAYYEQVIGNIDTAYAIYEEVMENADRNKDSLLTAKALSNMAIIQYQLQNFDQAEVSFLKSRDIYVPLKDSFMIAKIDANLACLYMEWGNTSKARKLFLDVIPRIKAIGDYGLLITAYKNYGQLFVKDYYNFDSASFYFEKAYSIVDFLNVNGIDVPASIKVDLLVELGNALFNDGKYEEAEVHYTNAFEIAESSSYASGRILASVGLGLVYSYLSQPSRSLYYLNLIDELETKSGISIAYSTIKAPLIMNYARLGKYDAMESELKDFKEEYEGLLRENNDVYEQISSLQEDSRGLLQQYESQKEQTESLRSQRDQYRLAFFGLLAIVLFVTALLIVYKIVRKKRSKV